MCFRSVLISLILFLYTYDGFSQQEANMKRLYQVGDTLFDNAINIRISLDSTGKSVIASDQENNLFWNTVPWEEKTFRNYDSSINANFRTNYIESFFINHSNGKLDPYIYLNFHNSPITAVIERQTGKFFLIEPE